MSNIKISEMAEAESLNDNDLLTIVQSGVNKKITKQNAIGDIIQAINNPTYTTTEGTDLSINNTRVGKMKFEYYGDTEQQTYTGVNKIGTLTDFVANDTSAINITYNTEANTITVKHLTTAAWKGIYKTLTGLTAGATMTISVYATTTTSTGWSLSVRNSGGTVIDETIHNTSGTETHFTFTVPNDGSITIRAYAGYGDVAVNDTATYSKFQLEYGSSVTAYEPYVGGMPSPNPDYPQEVKVVTGENTIDILGKNICPDTFSKYNVFSPYTQYNLPIKVGTECIMSFTDNDTSIDISGCYIGFKDSGTGAPTAIRWCINNGSVLSNTTNIPSTGTDWCGTICIYPNTEEAFNKLFGRYKIQVEIGNTISNYIPFQSSQSYELNLGKNILENKNGNILLNGLTFTKHLNGSITINGTATADTQYYMGIGNGNNIQKIDKLKTYSISIGQNFPFSAFFRISDANSSGTFKQCQNAYGTSTNKVENIAGSFFTSGKIIAQIFVYSGQIANNWTIYPQLEESPVATSYAQPNKPLELCKIGEFQDYIYNNGGRWFKHKEIEKLILNDISSFNISQIGTSNYYRFQVPLDTARNDTTLENTLTTFSNYFKPCKFNDRNTDYNNTVFQISNGLTTGLGVAFNTNVATTSADFKTWLNTHNAVAYYIAKEFTEEEIIDETTLNCLNNIKYGAESYYGQTNIMITSEELQPTLKVETLDKIGG